MLSRITQLHAEQPLFNKIMSLFKVYMTISFA